MSELAVLLGDDRIGCRVAHTLSLRYPTLTLAFNRSAEPLRVLRLLRKRRIALGDLINMAIAEWQRPAQTRLPLAEINDNASLLAWLAASRPRAVLCFRAGLLISPAALAAGVPFYNVHAAELPEFEAPSTNTKTGSPAVPLINTRASRKPVRLAPRQLGPGLAQLSATHRLVS